MKLSSRYPPKGPYNLRGSYPDRNWRLMSAIRAYEDTPYSFQTFVADGARTALKAYAYYQNYRNSHVSNHDELQIANTPFGYRPKGPSTRYRKKRASPSHKIPQSFNDRNVVTLKAEYDIPGWISVTTDKLDPTTDNTRQVLSAYKPLKTYADAGATLGAPTNAYWNDGVFTGIFNHFLAYPAESVTTDNAARPGVSNLMVKGRSLWGGSIIGANWDRDTNRFTYDYTGAAEGKPDIEAFGRNLINTKFMQYISWRVRLRETTYAIPYVYQTASMVNTLCTQFQFGGSSVAAADRAGTTTLEIKTALARLARVRVRNLIIRLPADPIDADPDSSDNSWEGALRGVFDGTEFWHDKIWNIIKEDLFLISDNTYGPPTGRNCDLYAQVNPKYAVLRDFPTYMGLNPDASSPPRPHTTGFYHRFNTSYTTSHSVGKTSASFALSEVADVGGDAAGITMDTDGPFDTMIESVDVVEPKARVKRPRYSGNADTDVHDEGYRYAQATEDAPTFVDANPDLEGVLNMEQVPTGTNPACFYPDQNRIIWIRIPRMANNIELDQIVQKKICYVPGDFTAAKQTMLLDALSQLVSTVQGDSTFKVLQPSVNSMGALIGMDDQSQATFGSNEPNQA